jgi:hypothetical protein
MKYVFRNNYEPRFPFYYQVTGLVLILDGIITFFVGFFNYSSDIYTRYCLWNIKQDIKKRKKERNK